MEDIPCHKYIISVDLVEHGTALAITHDDSSIAFYDTRTMVAFNGLDDVNTVTSLAQAGFQYPLDTPGMSTPIASIEFCGSFEQAFLLPSPPMAVPLWYSMPKDRCN